MLKYFEDVQSLSQQNADLVIKSLRDWNKTMPSTEILSFASRSFEEGATAFEAILAAKDAFKPIERVISLNGSRGPLVRREEQHA